METYFGNSIPILTSPKCSVIQAEIKTGIILSNHGEFYRSDLNQPHILIFDSFSDAEDFCKKQIIENPAIEFCIYNHLAEFVDVIRFK